MKKDIVFIINKHSGTGYSPSVEQKIIDACKRLNINCHLEVTKYKFHASEIANQAASSQYPVVFVLGGDGTINEVAQSLVNTSTALGLIPSGSGNGFARHLGTPFKIKNVLKLLENYKVLEIDTLKINNNLSINVAGIGFDAHIARLFENSKKRGLKTYSLLAYREFIKYKEFRITAKLNNEEITQNGFFIALANSSQYGNNAKIAPNASIVDGLMDVNIISKPALINLPVFISKLFLGKIQSSSLSKLYQTKKIEIILDVPVAFHIDGESRNPTNQFTVEIQPKSLKVIVPNVNATGY